MTTKDDSSLHGILNVLNREPHDRCNRSKAVVAAFERFLHKIEKADELEPENGIPHGSSQHDKYLYG